MYGLFSYTIRLPHAAGRPGENPQARDCHFGRGPRNSVAGPPVLRDATESYALLVRPE